MSMNLADYKDVWVYAEQREGKLMNVALELLGEGSRLSGDIGKNSKLCAVLIGNKVDHLVDELYSYGADKVYYVNHPILDRYTTDGYSKVLTETVKQYKPEIMLFGATHIGRDLAPRVAARLDTGLTADCTRLDINTANYVEYLEKNTTLNTETLKDYADDKSLKQTRPAFGGNLMATILCPRTRPQMATVRGGVMKKLEPNKGKKGELVNVQANLNEKEIRTKILDVVKEAKEMVSLTDAKIIVSGGRGLGNASGFDLIREFAKKVGGVVGSSRAAVDAGWIDPSHQVGQTGTTVKPNIYFACGISGAIQHQAGMSGADCIIAINKNPEAPIFEISNFALVGDLYKIIPELIAQWDMEG